MPDHKDYQSAMDKVAPSEDWKAATLQKMAAARAQQERPKAAPRLRVAKKVGVPLAAAAAVALMAVPAALRSGGLSAAGGTAPQTAMLYSAAAQDEAATSEAAMAEENMQDEMQAKGAPAAPRDFDLGEYEGLPVLVLGDDSDGMGGGATFVAESLDDIRGNNPTWNISANQLPATLPVCPERRTRRPPHRPAGPHRRRFGPAPCAGRGGGGGPHRLPQPGPLAL